MQGQTYDALRDGTGERQKVSEPAQPTSVPVKVEKQDQINLSPEATENRTDIGIIIQDSGRGQLRALVPK